MYSALPFLSLDPILWVQAAPMSVKTLWCSAGMRDLSLAERTLLLLVVDKCWGPGLWINPQGRWFRHGSEIRHGFSTSGARVFTQTCVMVPPIACSVGPQAIWGGCGKRVYLSQRHLQVQTGSAPLHKHCVDPKTSKCPISGSPCPPGPAGLAVAEDTKETQTAAYLRSYSNSQGCLVLFIFRSPRMKQDG